MKWPVTERWNVMLTWCKLLLFLVKTYGYKSRNKWNEENKADIAISLNKSGYLKLVRNMAMRQSIFMSSDIVHDYQCTPCEESGTNTEASHYCAHCGKQFCDACLQMHNHLFKRHTVHGKENVSMWSNINEHEKLSLSASMTSLSSTISTSSSQICPLHASEIQTYCRDHDVVCCTVCVATKHR